MMGWDIIDPSGSWPLGIIPSSPRPLDPSGPHPLGPSGPQPLSLTLTTRLHYFTNLEEGPMQWEMVMRKGYEGTMGYEQVSTWYYHSVSR